MKILIYQALDDPRFKSITSTLNSVRDVVIGSCDESVSEKDIKSFNPDVIIHNIPDKSKIFDKESIAINNSGYSFDKVGEKYLAPFVALQNKRDLSDIYISDVCFVGDVMDVFGHEINYVVQNNRISKLFFYHKPLQYRGYAGHCDRYRYHDLYAQSKASLVASPEDSYRILDILYAGGNPVIYENSEQFNNDIHKAVFNNESLIADKEKERSNIFNNHTNFDRMSTVLKDFGLTSLAGKLLDVKNNGEFL